MNKIIIIAKIGMYAIIIVLVSVVLVGAFDNKPTFAKPIVKQKPVALPVQPTEKPEPAPSPTPVVEEAPKPVSTLTIQVTASVPARTTAPQQTNPVDVGDTSLTMINETRTSLGFSPLQVRSNLNASAYGKCLHMRDNDYWAHTGAGRTSSSWNPGYSGFGEILARGYDNNPSMIHSAWLASHTHYNVIVLNWVGYFGVGRCTTLSGIDLTVVHFGGK